MPHDNGQDGTPQGVFGAELRYYRERAGLSQTEGYDTDSPAAVAQAVLRFDTLRSEALPRAASRDLILKIAGERWT